MVAKGVSTVAKDAVGLAGLVAGGAVVAMLVAMVIVVMVTDRLRVDDGRVATVE